MRLSNTFTLIILAIFVSTLNVSCKSKKDDDYAELKSQLANTNRRMQNIEASLVKRQKELADAQVRISELEYGLEESSKTIEMLLEETSSLRNEFDSERANDKTIHSKLEETEAETAKLADDFAEAGNMLAERQEKLLSVLEIEWEQMVLALESILSQTENDEITFRIEQNLIDAGQRIQQILEGEENAGGARQPER